MRILHRQVETNLYNGLISVLDNKVNLYRYGNTEISRTFGSISIYLHNNKICKIDQIENKLFLNDCGYTTKTTSSRLNVIGNHFGFEIKIIKGRFYLIKDNGEKIPFNYLMYDDSQYLHLDLETLNVVE